MWPFNKSWTAQPKNVKIEMTQRERLIILAVIAIALVIIAVVVLVAASAGTPLSRCSRIIVSQQRSACLLGLANATGNVSICSYLHGSQSEECVSGIALASGNPSLCSSLSYNGSFYAQCVISTGMSSHTASYCLSLSEPYLSSCVYTIAEASNFSSVSECGYITNSSLRGECDAKSYYEEALKSRNASYCADLPSALNSTLVSYMAGASARVIGVSNASATLPYLNATTPMQYCYYNVALLGRNSAICSLAGSKLSAQCNATLSTSSSYTTGASNAITLQNVTALCSDAPASVQSLCSDSLYSYIAVKQRNVSVCGLISSGIYQSACYTSLARTYNDSSYCSYIQNSTLMSDCLIPGNTTT